MLTKCHFGDRIRANGEAQDGYAGCEGVVVEHRRLTQEELIHFDRGAFGSAWLLDSSLDPAAQGSWPLVGAGLSLAALALGGFLIAPHELHTHSEISGDPGELESVDLTAPGVTGSQIGMSYVQLAVDLRDRRATPAVEETTRQVLEEQNPFPSPRSRAPQHLLNDSEKGIDANLANRDVWLHSWYDYFRKRQPRE